MIPFADLDSVTPIARHRAATRIDPYWDGVWQQGSNANWVSREHLVRMERAGISGRRPKLLSVDPAVAEARLLDDWQAKLDLLGMIHAWRTVTTEQFAALTGNTIQTTLRIMGDLFALDVIDFGSLWSGSVSRGPVADRGRMVRPTASHAFDRIIRPRMSYAEWVSVTAGAKFASGGQYDRHNTLTTELALRAAEFLPIGTVLGERQAVATDLAFTGVGLEIPADLTSTQQAGDAVIIRPDGVRIVIEVTASWGPDAKRKAEKWARIMTRQPFGRTGLVVVFVVADHPSLPARTSVANDVRKTVTQMTRLVPGTPGNRTAERMFVTGWRDWFPARGEASPAFLDLVALRPTGVDGAFEQAAIMSPADVPSPENPALTTVVHTAAGLRFVPHWLRETRRPPQFAAYPLRRFGWDGIPQVLLNPRTGAPRRQVGSPQGARGRVRIPQRLRYGASAG